MRVPKLYQATLRHENVWTKHTSWNEIIAALKEVLWTPTWIRQRRSWVLPFQWPQAWTSNEQLIIRWSLLQELWISYWKVLNKNIILKLPFRHWSFTNRVCEANTVKWKVSKKRKKFPCLYMNGSMCVCVCVCVCVCMSVCPLRKKVEKLKKKIFRN